MADIRIAYSVPKLKKYTIFLWVTTVVLVICAYAAKLFVGGYVGAGLNGSLTGAWIAVAFIALSFSVRLPDRFNKSASIAVICAEGIRITDDPYSFGLIRWKDITGFTLKKTGIGLSSRYYIAPQLADPDAFMNSLSKKKRKVAKHGKRLGSFASFEVTHAAMPPNDLHELFVSNFCNAQK